MKNSKMQKHLAEEHVFNRELVLSRKFTFFHIRKRTLEKAHCWRFGRTNTAYEFSISLNLSKFHLLRLQMCSGSGCSKVVTKFRRHAKSGGSSRKPAMTGATFPKKKRPPMRTELTQLVLKPIVWNSEDFLTFWAKIWVTENLNTVKNMSQSG